MRSVELRVSSGHRLITDPRTRLHPSSPTKLTPCSKGFRAHATAGVALIETGAGTEPDLADALERLLRPRTSTGIAMAAWGTVATT